MAAYEQAKSAGTPLQFGSSRTVPGTVNASIVSYNESSAFKDALAKSTQTSRRAVLESLRDDHGDKRVALMHSAALQNIFNGKSPADQRNGKKALRRWIDHCLSLKLVKADPLSEVKLAKMKTVGASPMAVDECEQFEKTHAVGTRALGLRVIAPGWPVAMRRRPDRRQQIRKGVMTIGR